VTDSIATTDERTVKASTHWQQSRIRHGRLSTLSTFDNVVLLSLSCHCFVAVLWNNCRPTIYINIYEPRDHPVTTDVVSTLSPVRTHWRQNKSNSTACRGRGRHRSCTCSTRSTLSNSTKSTVSNSTLSPVCTEPNAITSTAPKPTYGVILNLFTYVLTYVLYIASRRKTRNS